ncbi:hypothetical protein Back2_00620 [Nocardioides baekrokdamisoli]|uniref:Uncharacterized protein n=1 Tax=Nocardioides baekrokdamisoli TaxID=1804624 RepID=A0A3G9IIC7_9ACTN|nr:hypothetical protein [Nocardioides baekrokdamisoli]BBH15775.1 hypothetical protein Back2_00620 [Nocardioides baekrokdamisoli]
MLLNPFEVTKAVDFSDDEILDKFVDFPKLTFNAIVNPASPMPQFLVSGKGGGRTHLMRYYSYPIQKRRATRQGSKLLDSINSDGYLGVYMRCSGLNGLRFTGKGIDDEAWQTVFAAYMDIWITENLLNVLCDMQHNGAGWSIEQISNFCAAMNVLLPPATDPDEVRSTTLDFVIESVRGARRDMDRAVNDAAFTRELHVEVYGSPGDLVFGAAASASRHLHGLGSVRFTYLVDEFENLSEAQQMYLNTLIREKQLPCSFMIGSRTPGVRTHKTLSAGEENRKGSEYELIELDNRYREDAGSYGEFCARLALNRLNRLDRSGGIDYVASEAELRAVLGGASGDVDHVQALVSLLAKKSAPHERPHLKRLWDVVYEQSDNESLASQIVTAVAVEENPVIERLRIHRFYQSLRSTSGQPTLEGAREAAAFLPSVGRLSRESKNYVGLWRVDMTAHVYNSIQERMPQQGLDKLIETSGFLPRNFLIILKSIARYVDFAGGEPFVKGSTVDAKAQLAGVADASSWFVSDALPSGPLGNACDIAIRRLGNLLQRARYSDKPNEVGYAAFSIGSGALTEDAQRVLDACVSHELLVEIPNGRSARNYGPRLRKYQLHPMVAPSYSLPTSRRGEMRLVPAAASAVFDAEVPESEYLVVLNAQLATMKAPFSRKRSSKEEPLFDA